MFLASSTSRIFDKSIIMDLDLSLVMEALVNFPKYHTNYIQTNLSGGINNIATNCTQPGN